MSFNVVWYRSDHIVVGYAEVFKLLQLVAQVFELKTEGAGENSMTVSEAVIHVELLCDNLVCFAVTIITHHRFSSFALAS